MVFFIDSNIFLRTLINENTQQHQSCVKLLRLIKNNKIKAITGSVILAEIVWTLNSFYQLEKEVITTAVQSIINLRGLSIVDNYDHSLALSLYHNHSVKYIDALIASIPSIQTREITIVTYDKDFDKLKVIRKEPDEI
ncbi:hypothetical protein COW98_03080 [Candidatus Roizmanbacteria bacterium CG22_combo_CG10-13_8_21_14_all_35_9]|uniref:PIN domain-containing protein n=2 Tax=Candidatus Roizmaniibacteriota TaxID=1752723 RepID=A0A2M7LSH8_9BACT|nr:MAG: hypothetical protein COW98_03080 [Candidatus Roizmanbacteria bacterium CG22_combo_CG10-13_8_21_14_all_35_9]PIX71012.1 MAG: hypothetical protein COZ39_04055 [Candidatus Roizmanbacteria bacterium CG_4_10_14_3_um_filter_33_21]